jgi:small basic protein
MSIATYNKAVGAAVGGLVGAVLVSFGLSDTAGVPEQYQPIVDILVQAIMAAIGAWRAPKNAA